MAAGKILKCLFSIRYEGALHLHAVQDAVADIIVSTAGSWTRLLGMSPETG